MSQTADKLIFLSWATNPEEPVIREHNDAMKALDASERFERIEAQLLNYFAALRLVDEEVAQGADAFDDVTLSKGAASIKGLFDRLIAEWDAARARDGRVRGPSQEFLDALELLRVTSLDPRDWHEGRAVKSSLESVPEAKGGRPSE